MASLADVWSVSFVGLFVVFLLYRVVDRTRRGRLSEALVNVALLELMVLFAVAFTPLQSHFSRDRLTLVALAVMLLMAITLVAAWVVDNLPHLRRLVRRLSDIRARAPQWPE